MSNFKISAAARNAGVNGVVDLLDGGTPPGRLEVRAGTIPANPAAASGGTLLGTLPFSNPAFGNGGATVVGRADAAAITSDTNADNSGTASFWRAYPGAAADTACVFQGDAGTAATDMIFDNNVIVAGGTIAVSSMQITVPEQ